MSQLPLDANAPEPSPVWSPSPKLARSFMVIDFSGSERTIPRPYPADLPGVTVEWLAHANNCSPRSIRRWRDSLPPDNPATADLLNNMTPELAQEMALRRPRRGVLPFW